MFRAELIEVYCPECAGLQACEQPPCRDGHGTDCPERLCLSCGTGLLIGAPVEPRPRTLGSRAA